jgi:hypothetical protein
LRNQVKDQQARKPDKSRHISLAGKVFVALLLSLPLLRNSSKVRTVAFDHGCTTQGKEERQDKRRREKEETIAGYRRTGPDSLTVRASLGLLCTRRPKKGKKYTHKKERKEPKSLWSHGSSVVIRVSIVAKTCFVAGSRPSSLALWRTVRKPMTSQKSNSQSKCSFRFMFKRSVCGV